MDSCSSNNLLVRASTWDAVGGLDDDFFPAGHVDGDLAMRIRRHGQVVMSEPAARATHVRNASSTRRYQRFIAVRNGLRFRERWRSVLEREHEPPGELAPQEDARALERAEVTRRRAAERARSEPAAAPTAAAPGSSPEPLAANADEAERAAVGFRYIQRHLELRMAHQSELEAELDRLEAEREELLEHNREAWSELHRTRDRLEAIEAGRWWRLRGRLLSVLSATGIRSRADQG